MNNEGKNASIDEAINNGNFKLAEELLENYKQSFGKTPQYIYFLSKLKLAQNDLKSANENLKILYYYFPVFMADKNDYLDFVNKYITIPLKKAKQEMNTIIAKLAFKSVPLETKAEIDNFDNNMQTQMSETIYETQTKHLEKSEHNDVDLEGSISHRESLRQKLVEIIEVFKKILEIEPKHIEALSCLIQSYSELGYVEEVIKIKNRLETAPSYWENLRKKRVDSTLQEAKKAFKEGNLELTNKILSLGLAESVDDPNLLILKAEVSFKQNNYKEALSILESVIKKHPNNNEALRVKGKVCAAKFEYDYNKAHELLTQAEEMPIETTLQINKVQEALDYFLQALEYDENNVLVLYGVYRCHVLLNNPLKAHTTLMKIYELDPHFKVPKLLNLFKKKQNPNEINDIIPEPCFISTRIYGKDSNETKFLKKIRDDYILPTKLGKIFFVFYKKIGFSLAKLPKKSITIKIIKYLLNNLLIPILKKFY